MLKLNQICIRKNSTRLCSTHKLFPTVILLFLFVSASAFSTAIQQPLAGKQTPSTQETRSHPEQENPNSALLNIKQEQEEISISELRSSPVFVKTEDEDKPQFPQVEGPIIILDEEDSEGPEPQTELKTEAKADLCSKTQEPHSDVNVNNALNTIGLNSLNLFRCSECGKTYSSQSYLKLHIQYHAERPYRCPVCRKCFTWRGRLQKHMRTHTGEKPFKCAVCCKRFSESGNLKVHMRIHTGEKPFSCSFCGKSYAQRGNLKMHMAIAHTGEKPFRCPVCWKCFSWNACLQKHVKIHTGEKPYRCTVCAITHFSAYWLMPVFTPCAILGTLTLGVASSRPTRQCSEPFFFNDL
uniref:C2H2-type domain-containing protein n=1 Tax=Oryzias sinensis TaxID=183150 RepID=A0A8C7ZBZ6_9TELE